MGKANPGKERNLESEVAGEGEFQHVEREQAGEAVIKGDGWQEQDESNIVGGGGLWRRLLRCGARRERVSRCRGGSVGATMRQSTKIFPMQELRKVNEYLAVGLCNPRPASILFSPSFLYSLNASLHCFAVIL